MNQNFGNMMGAQQQPQQQQHPPPPPPPQHQRLQQVILAQLRQSHRPQPGQWQATLNAEQRAGMLWNIYTAIRLAKPDAPDQQVLQMAFGNENERFVKASSREDYIRTVKELLQRLQSMRQQNMQAVQASMMHPGNNAANPQAGMMPQTPMQPSGSNQGQNAFQQPFPPQLQHQMQASPLPMTQNPSSMGMENPNLQPQAQQQNMPPQMQRPQQFTPEEQQKLETMTRTLRQRLTPEEESRIRAQIAQLPPDRRQMLESRGVDPVMLHCRNRAQAMLMNMKKGQQVGQGGQFGQQQNQGMGRGAPNQGMMQRTPQVGNVQPQQGGIPGNADFDFAQLTNQQADAMRSAQAGHDVVPASNNVNMNQMGGFNPMSGGQPGQANGQGMPPGQNRNSGQQTPFNLQQAQRENAIRQMQAAQAQAQAAQARGQGIPHSQAQQMALRNQMGGFSMGPGQPQNGAMPMLTRPMAPPGQQGNATPQPRPQQPGQQIPQTMGPGINAAQAVQMAQQRAAAAQAQMPGAPQASRASQIPADVPMPIRQKMMELPEEQFRMVLTRWIQQKQGWAGNANVSQPGQQMNPQALQGGQPGAPMGMGGNFLQQNQQMAGMMNPAQMQQRLQQELLRRQQQQQNGPALNPQIMQRMDQTAFPPVVTQGIKNNGVNIPDNIRLWGQLKEWASRNPNIISMDKLNEFQKVHYERMQQAQQQAQQQQQQQQANSAGMHGLPGGLPNGAGPLGPGHPNGQAPQAPMMAGGGGNSAQMQQHMAAAAQRQRIFALAQQISPQDIQRIRQQQGQKVANMTDDALRQQIAVIRLQQQRALQQNPQPGMMQQGPGGNIGMPQAPNMQPQRPGQPPQPQATPQPKPTQQPPAPQRPTPQPGQAPNATPKTQAQKGIKRPSSDDVVEVSDPSKPQAPPMQPSQSQQRPPNLTQEQFNALNPQQQAAYRQKMLQAAQAQGNKQAQGTNAQQQEQLKRQFTTMMHEFMKANSLDNRPPVDVPPEARAQISAEVQKNMQWINKLDQIMFMDWIKHRDDQRAKSIITVRHMLHSQLDPQTRKLKDNLTANPPQIQKMLHHIIGYIRSVIADTHSEKAQPQPNGQEGAQQQQQQQPRSQAQGGQGAELNAVNLEKLRQEQLQRPRASSNAGAKPPAAPTSAQPPFSFGGGQSPNGAPLYGSANPLTPEKLKLPQNKKRKMNGASATSTPNQTTPVHTTSPMVGNKASPEMTRREGPQQPVPAKPRFTCPHQTCDFSAKGFETKDELESHVKDAHAKVEDPLKFAIDSVNESLALNPDCTPKQPKADPGANSRGRPAPAMPKQPLAAKPGQTPQIKAEAGTPATGAAATPMNRVPTQTGVKSSPSTNFKTPQATVKAQTPGSTGASAMNRTPSKATKDTNKPADATMEDQSAPKPAENPWNECPLSPSQLHFMFADEDVAKAMFELPNKAFIAKEDVEREEQEKNQEKVEPRSTTPATTPSPASTKDSKETGTSDISENDKLTIALTSDDEWNQRAMEADVDFSDMMNSLFVFDDANNMTLPQNEGNQDMTGPYGFWRDNLGTGDDKIPNWDSTELGAPYDFINAPSAPTNEQDLQDLFGIVSNVNGMEDMGMMG